MQTTVLSNKSINNVLNGRLIPLSEEAIKGLPFSERTRNFLLSTGLPDKADEDLKDKLLLTFYHSSPNIRQITLNGEDYIIIGDDEEVYVGIKQNTDEVFLLDESQETWNAPVKFINSNIQDFIECLGLYLSYEDKLVNADDKEATRIVNEIKAQFKEIDSKSLNNQNNFWSVILEQVEAGLM